MTGRELLRRLREYGRRVGVEVRHERPDRGKGSHSLVVVGSRRATVPDLRRDLRVGTLRSIVRDLGLRMEDVDR